MGIERDHHYYDLMYQGAPIRQKARDEQPWTVLWEAVAKACVVLGQPVIDCGCGDGHLVHYLNKYGSEVAYKGLDFSSIALERAKAAYGDRPNTRFIRATFPDDIPWDTEHTYVFCEVLEHITDDRRCLHQVPILADVILTLPTKDDPSHVRFFKKLNAAIERYRDVIAFEKVYTINGRWHYLQGVRQ